MAVESGECAGASWFSQRREEDLNVLLRQRVRVVDGVQKHGTCQPLRSPCQQERTNAREGYHEVEPDKALLQIARR